MARFIAPLFEELLFRGFLTKGLETSFLGMSGAVAVTSLFWAAIHLQYDLLNVGIIFFLGCSLAQQEQKILF